MGMALRRGEMTAAASILFLVCIVVLAYVYVGYPLVVYAAGLILARPVRRDNIEPTVTILITAFNEESAIREKLANTLAIEYPKDKLEILVASDGSTDRTDEIVKEHAHLGVKLYRQEGRLGKTVTQNSAVAAASGEIVLFSDATTEYTPDVLRRVLPAFADDTVGCVAGRLVYLDNGETNVGTGAQSYWNYETFLKTSESRACSLIGASGCLYAVRRSAYRPMYAEACSDFLICTELYRQGLRSIFEPDAVCYEHTNQRTHEEFKMRVRVISQTYTDLWRNADMLNPFKSGFYAVQLISHKLLRYCVPLILALILVTNVFLAGRSLFWDFLLLGQMAVYIAAFLGWLVERAGRRITLLAIPLYFVLANLASAIAFFRFVRGERVVTWEPIRESR
ncbi:MAG: glycosyltransferase family 2 protein [Chloracidobacterium sp.]|nr:glycosyltransferase family 2 protein [Chloracidobacterium sp.]